jgi:hypothetical protein
VYPRVIAELVPAARHLTEQYANNAVEADHGRLKARLRPMRGLKTIRSLRRIAAGHAFVQTCAAATTNSPSTHPPTIGFGSRSPISRATNNRDDQRAGPQRWPPIDQRNRTLKVVKE